MIDHLLGCTSKYLLYKSGHESEVSYKEYATWSLNCWAPTITFFLGLLGWTSRIALKQPGPPLRAPGRSHPHLGSHVINQPCWVTSDQWPYHLYMVMTGGCSEASGPGDLSHPLVRPAEFVTSLIGWFVNIVKKWRIPKTHHEIPEKSRETISVNVWMIWTDMAPPGVWTSLKDVPGGGWPIFWMDNIHDGWGWCWRPRDRATRSKSSPFEEKKHVIFGYPKLPDNTVFMWLKQP